MANLPPLMDRSTISSILIAGLPVAVTWKLLRHRRNQPADPSTQRSNFILETSESPMKFTTTDISTCQKILVADDFIVDDISMDVYNRFSKLEARAGPNQRLVEAFGIDNSFTTTDNVRCREFRRQAEQLLVSRTENWTVWSTMAKTIIRNELQIAEESGKTEISLVPLVQNLALKIALHVLFGKEPDLTRNDDYGYIALSINDIWMSSKARSDLDWSQLTKLHQALENVIPPPTDALIPQQNPMNLILPAYETLWRVVLRGFVEVVYRNPTSEDTLIWRQALKDFLNDPCKQQLQDTYKHGVAANWIAKEALRLYPPTRRVYRHYEAIMNDQIETVTVAADLEAAQRNPEAWPNDPERFIPTRWKGITRSEEGQFFMAFGAKPFSCPAKMDFGPRMIALLVAALSEGIGNNWELMAYDSEDELIERPMETDRESYTTMYLKRKPQEGA